MDETTFSTMRTLDWEHQYEIGETPWEKGGPSPPLLEWLEDNPDTLSGRVLVPGCGLGHDVRAIAATNSELELVGLDISSSAIATAEDFSKVSSEVYRQADLFALETAEIGSFDSVFEHTCFCAIDPARRDEYVKAVSGLLKAEGSLLGVFFL
ncbi:MAG: methyltransferase, partial [Verrucomicrobiota bacterium]